MEGCGGRFSRKDTSMSTPLLLKVVAVVRFRWMPTTASTLSRTWEGRRDPERGLRDHDDEFISSKAADPPVEDMDKVRMRFSIRGATNAAD